MNEKIPAEIKLHILGYCDDFTTIESFIKVFNIHPMVLNALHPKFKGLYGKDRNITLFIDNQLRSMRLPITYESEKYPTDWTVTTSRRIYWIKRMHTVGSNNDEIRLKRVYDLHVSQQAKKRKRKLNDQEKFMIKQYEALTRK